MIDIYGTELSEGDEGYVLLKVFNELGFAPMDYDSKITRRNTDALLEEMFARDLARRNIKKQKE